jgi:hypothetical protein
MKSHFQDYMLYNDLSDREILFHNKAKTMLADVKARNTIWDNALTETKKKRASQAETTATAKTLMEVTKEKVDTLYQARVSAKNGWIAQNKIEATTFDSISTKRKEFLSNHSTFKDQIKHVYNHPVWKTFKEKAVADQGSGLA